MKLSIEPDKRYNSAYALHIKKENLFTSWHLPHRSLPFPTVNLLSGGSKQSFGQRLIIDQCNGRVVNGKRRNEMSITSLDIFFIARRYS